MTVPSEKKEVSSYEYATESATNKSDPKTNKTDPPLAAKTNKKIDPEIWKEARGTLRTQLDSFGEHKFESDYCTIKSLFDHPKHKVAEGRSKVSKDMKDELSDTIQEVLYQLNITAKKH